MKKALIIGIDSTIGAALQQTLRASGWSVFGTSRRKELCDEKTHTFYLDLSHPEETVFEVAIDVVFLCASLTKVSFCQENPATCQQVNVNAQMYLATYFLHQGVHVIFLSTSAVFAGDKPFNKVGDATSPKTIYGQSKATVEKQLLEASDHIAIVRLTKVLTPEYPLIVQWIRALKNGNVITPFHDLLVCPISIKTVVLCLKEIAEKKMCGIIHLSGEKDWTYQEVAEYLAHTIGVKPSLVQASAFGHTAAPTYTSLDMRESNLLFNMPNTSLFSTLDDLYAELLTSSQRQSAYVQ